MEKLASMVVPIREVPCHRRVALEAPFIREAVEGLPIRAALERPADDPNAGAGEADLDLYIEGENVFVRGKLQGWVEVACSRCVGPVRISVDEPLHVTYVPRAALPESSEEDEEVQLSEEDLELYPYENQEIDLQPLLREQIIMAVPFAPLCAEDCKGLCPSCGIDRNHETCDCEPPIDPRLAALKDLKR